MRAGPIIKIGGWTKLSLPERVAKIRLHYGEYPIIISAKQNRIGDLNFCLPNLFANQNLDVLIYRDTGKYVLAKSVEEKSCNIEAASVPANFTLTPSKENWICEAELRQSKSLSVKVYSPDSLSDLQNIFGRYRQFDLSFTS